jgi:hypothetical protein
MIAGVLRMLLGLGGMFLALGVIVLAVRIGGGTMGLRCGLVMFRRFVVCVFHLISRRWPKNIGAPSSGLKSGRTECQ